MFTNCIAYAKLVYNKRLKAYKVQFAFNVHKKMVGDEIKYIFPVQAKCNYVSGDLLADNLQNELASVLPTVYATLRTNSVEFVD